MIDLRGLALLPPEFWSNYYHYSNTLLWLESVAVVLCKTIE